MRRAIFAACILLALSSCGKKMPAAASMRAQLDRVIDGNTLVVETDSISAEFFDYEGTPQSSDARYIERFVPTDDSSRLNYRITVVDPATFTETFELSRYFVWRPELVVNPYDCFVATE